VLHTVAKRHAWVPHVGFWTKAQKKMRHASGFFQWCVTRPAWRLMHQPGIPIKECYIKVLAAHSLGKNEFCLVCISLFDVITSLLGRLRAGWYIFIMRARHQEEFLCSGIAGKIFRRLFSEILNIYKEPRAHQRMRAVIWLTSTAIKNVIFRKLNWKDACVYARPQWAEHKSWAFYVLMLGVYINGRPTKSNRT